MAINIINDPNRNPWQSLAGGLGNLLGGLAASKLNQITERHRKTEQRSLFEKAGYSPEQAELLASYGSHPAEQIKVAQMLGQVAPQQQFQQSAGIAPQESFTQQPQIPAQWMQGLQQLQQGAMPDASLRQSLSRRLGLPELPSQQVGRELSQAIQQGQLQPELVQQQTQAPMQMIPHGQAPSGLPQLQPQGPKSIASTLGAYETPQEKQARLKREQQERHFQSQQERDREKELRRETKEIRQEIHKEAQQAKEVLHDIERQEELNDSGKLDTAGYTTFLEEAGLNIPALMNPESQEFNKISVNYLRNAKQYFGGKVSDYEMRTFLQAIPSLSQSPEGRKRVFANLKRLQRGKIAYQQALNEEIKENGITDNLQENVYARTDKKMEHISEQFRNDLLKPVPEGQKSYITALQALAAKGISRLPKAAAGAAIGAQFGKAAGIPGAIAGGLAGGLAGLGGVTAKDLLGF